MLKVSRKLLKLFVLLGLAVALVFAVRALMDWIAGEPGVPNTPSVPEVPGTPEVPGVPGTPAQADERRRGSYDSWPAVPQAPGREAGSGTAETDGC